MIMDSTHDMHTKSTKGVNFSSDSTVHIYLVRIYKQHAFLFDLLLVLRLVVS